MASTKVVVKVYEFVFAYVLASALNLAGLVVGTFVFTWLPMLVLGAAHSVHELSWIPPLGFVATWVFILAVSLVAWAVRGGLELIKVDMSVLLKKQ